VVIIGWNDTNATINSVTDSAGNTYSLAAGPTLLSGLASQSIYYAQNITSSPANGNAVTVTFSVAANYPDVRILEYSGIDPNNSLDSSGAATNTGGSTATSGAVGTTSADDLLVAADYVQTLTAAVGAGFALRMLTVPDGDLVEDSLTTATGSYSASAPLVNPGWWVMQIVAFRAAGSPSPTTYPYAHAFADSDPHSKPNCHSYTNANSNPKFRPGSSDSPATCRNGNGSLAGHDLSR